MKITGSAGGGATDDGKKCTVIVVTYNGKKEWYDKGFDSLLSSSVPVNVIAVDNKSTDDTVSYITGNFPEVKLTRCSENFGFAKANNIGLGFAYSNNADCYFLLNQDAWVEQNTIETLITVAGENPDFGLLSPIHLSGDKASFDPGFKKYFGYGSDAVSAYENLRLKKPEPVLYESDFVNAAAWLLTKRCVETVGGFDTILFRHFGEDNNYCHRVKFHGLKIGIVPAVTMCHDRTYRVSSSLSSLHGSAGHVYSMRYGNVLSPPAKHLVHLGKAFLRALCLKGTKSFFREVFWVIKNLRKVVKSRKINRTAGKGLEHLCSLAVENTG